MFLVNVILKRLFQMLLILLDQMVITSQQSKNRFIVIICSARHHILVFYPLDISEKINPTDATPPICTKLTTWRIFRALKVVTEMNESASSNCAGSHCKKCVLLLLMQGNFASTCNSFLHFKLIIIVHNHITALMVCRQCVTTVTFHHPDNPICMDG